MSSATVIEAERAKRESALLLALISLWLRRQCSGGLGGDPTKMTSDGLEVDLAEQPVIFVGVASAFAAGWRQPVLHVQLERGAIFATWMPNVPATPECAPESPAMKAQPLACECRPSVGPTAQGTSASCSHRPQTCGQFGPLSACQLIAETMPDFDHEWTQCDGTSSSLGSYSTVGLQECDHRRPAAISISEGCQDARQWG